MKALDSLHKSRERAFHDEWAKQTPLAEIKVLEAFENITAQENQFILGLMGDLKGVSLLDIGAGLGESSVYFALQGAKVTANDISQAMLNRCVALGKRHGVRIGTLLNSSSEEADFGEGKFDIVYGANVPPPHRGSPAIFGGGPASAASARTFLFSTHCPITRPLRFIGAWPLRCAPKMSGHCGSPT